MGLLDDAIREHLELKRRRGADPSDIARAEHEALEPIFPDESSSFESGPDTADPGVADAAEDNLVPATDEQPLAQIGQETAELDMQAMLDADREQPGHIPAAHGPPDQQDETTSDRFQDSERDLAPHEIPGQERLSLE